MNRWRRLGANPTVRTAVLVAFALLALVLAVWVLPIVLTRRPAMDAPERHAAMTDARGSLLAALGALGALIGVVHGIGTYRLTQASHLSGRFQDAASLMGEDDASKRLGGIEAMALLDDQWPDGRQRCIDVLCGHVRHLGRTDDSAIDHDDRLDTQRRVVELLVEGVSVSGWRGCRLDLRKADLDLDLCGCT